MTRLAAILGNTRYSSIGEVCAEFGPKYDAKTPKHFYQGLSRDNLELASDMQGKVIVFYRKIPKELEE